MADVQRPAAKRRRISNSAIDMQTAINQPGPIEINVTGAYIVDHADEDTSQLSNGSSPSSNLDSEEQSYRHHQRDIRLPNHTSVVSHVAADIGGSLAKVVYFSRENGHAEAGGRLNFLSFETEKIDDCIEYLRVLQTRHKQTNGAKATELSVQATGGGAYKFYDRIKERLGVDVQREDEMECLIMGLDFFITEIPMEVFTYDDTQADNAVTYQKARSDVYPYLLVNIGSGVSMIKVSGPSQFQRIGGTSLGGGTLWGLLSLLTGARNFDDMLAMADKGDNGSVDLLVGDIYGEGMGYEKIGLSEKTIASSFGKVLKRKREAERNAEDGSGLNDSHVHRSKQANGESAQIDVPRDSLVGDGRMFKPEDISRSLLYAISNNIGQIAYLQSEKHDLQRIYFGGSFIRGHQQTIHTLSFAIKFWSKGTKQAFFLRHEGYLGAVGAFIKRRPVHLSRRGSVTVDES
ncbi:pantothenate kinase 4 [Teratosphaeria nubilosa]|uniref:Pantothenate kinase 4 n=1 Tax=Teratosphaeria nubilosa TaxID=161662 RepID=A0A6G1L0I9_9PEZI|nr:pantothenate kinase 4 [Teratosphaeria nubilosa]